MLTTAAIIALFGKYRAGIASSWQKWRLAVLQVRIRDCRAAEIFYAMRDLERMDSWQEKRKAAEKKCDQYLRRVLPAAQ